MRSAGDGPPPPSRGVVIGLIVFILFVLGLVLVNTFYPLAPSGRSDAPMVDIRH